MKKLLFLIGLLIPCNLWAFEMENSTYTWTGAHTFQSIYTLSVNTVTANNVIDIKESSGTASPAVDTGRLYTTDENGTARLNYVDDGGNIIHLGEDNTEIVRNVSGTQIDKGKVVYVSGQTGNTMEIGLAIANSTTTMPAIGFAMENISNNDYGVVMLAGTLESIDTSSFSAGDTVLVSTMTAGSLSKHEPVHPNIYQRMGQVATSGVGNGSIVVNAEPAFNYKGTAFLKKTADSNLDMGSYNIASTGNIGTAGSTTFYGDGSNLTGIGSGGADNLGNHTATTTLTMGSFSIQSSSSIHANEYFGDGSNLTGVSGGGTPDVYGTISGDVFDSTTTFTGGLNSGIFKSAWTLGEFVFRISSTTTGGFTLFLDTAAYGASYGNVYSTAITAGQAQGKDSSLSIAVSDDGAWKMYIQSTDTNDPPGGLTWSFEE